MGKVIQLLHKIYKSVIVLYFWYVVSICVALKPLTIYVIWFNYLV